MNVDIDRFPMGFWNYVPTGIYGPKAVKDWQDAGMTITMSPEYNPMHHKKQDMLDLLDECEKRKSMYSPSTII